MGTYVNPGNDDFALILRGEYVDKTGIVALMNDALDTSHRLVAVTRPRRFGKTYAAAALVAYYSCGCDSGELFAGLELGRSEHYLDHLNRYNVVRLDMSAFRDAPDVVKEATRVLLADLRDIEPKAGLRDAGHHNELTSAFLDVVRATGRKFVFVIDEWDAPLRERGTAASREDWVMFLRLLFKNATFTGEAVTGAYITGILPIKRYGTQSALSDFDEYTMLAASDYAPYVGFLESEVERLAGSYDMDMSKLRRWYDGYELPRAGHVYAPFSVMRACMRREIGPYWASSETFSMLRTYIDLDYDGLQQSIVQALGGASVRVDTGTFDNDLHEVNSRDDALTLLIHLGYLAYDAATGTARVPNEEVRAELRRAVRNSHHEEVARIVRDSDALLESTWDMDEEAVAAGIARAHDHGCAPTFYNNEQALRAVVKSAYISAVDHYLAIEELPSGRGVADVVYVPRPGSSAPAMVVELKWNRTPEAALAQIRERGYPDVLRNWGGEVLLVGVSYDPKGKEHGCAIERL